MPYGRAAYATKNYALRFDVVAPPVPCPAAVVGSVAEAGYGASLTLDLTALPLAARDIIVVAVSYLGSGLDEECLAALSAAELGLLDSGDIPGSVFQALGARHVDGTETTVTISTGAVNPRHLGIVAVELENVTGVASNSASEDGVSLASTTPESSTVVFAECGITLSFLAGSSRILAIAPPTGWTLGATDDVGGLDPVAIAYLDSPAGVEPGVPWGAALDDDEWITHTLAIVRLSAALDYGRVDVDGGAMAAITDPSEAPVPFPDAEDPATAAWAPDPILPLITPAAPYGSTKDRA